MADDRGEAIEIIGALSDAGLLRTAPSGATAAAGGSEAVRMIGALREAGLLAAGAVAPAVPPEPKQGPQVGDEVRAQGIRQINKRVLANGSKEFAFGTKQEEGQWWWVECRFPPNDNHWLAEIDKVLASPKPSIFHVEVEVTQVVGVYGYMTIVEGELKELTAVYRTPELPALSTS